MVQSFLQQDLSQEALSRACEKKRLATSNTINDIINKIRRSHPSIRPRINTPGGIKKPPPPVPPVEPPIVPFTEEEEEGELYEEPAPDPQPPPQAEDYLSFEPAYPLDNGAEEEPQEVYEAMETIPDQELYEEPGQSVRKGGREG